MFTYNLFLYSTFSDLLDLEGGSTDIRILAFDTALLVSSVVNKNIDKNNTLYELFQNVLNKLYVMSHLSLTLMNIFNKTKADISVYMTMLSGVFPLFTD